MDGKKIRKRWYSKEVMRRRLEWRQIRKAVMHRCFFGSGIGNPRYKELIAKAHIIIEHGTCGIKNPEAAAEFIHARLGEGGK